MPKCFCKSTRFLTPSLKHITTSVTRNDVELSFVKEVVGNCSRIQLFKLSFGFLISIHFLFYYLRSASRKFS